MQNHHLYFTPISQQLNVIRSFRCELYVSTYIHIYSLKIYLQSLLQLYIYLIYVDTYRYICIGRSNVYPSDEEWVGKKLPLCTCPPSHANTWISATSESPTATQIIKIRNDWRKIVEPLNIIPMQSHTNDDKSGPLPFTSKASSTH